MVRGDPDFPPTRTNWKGMRGNLNRGGGLANQDTWNGEDDSDGKPLNARPDRSTPTVTKDKPARVLITGVPGLVGSPLLTRLLEQEDTIRLYALPDTINDIPHRDRIAVVTGDLRTGLNLAQSSAWG
jgi:hypothetical protein